MGKSVNPVPWSAEGGECEGPLELAKQGTCVHREGPALPGNRGNGEP